MSIVLRDGGMFTEVRDSQRRKTYLSIVVTEFPKVTEVRLGHASKQETETTIIEEDNLTVVNIEPVKH